MVNQDRYYIQEQKRILGLLYDTNIDITSEYEAQQLIKDAIIELKENNNLSNFNIGMFAKDITLGRWKMSKSKNDYYIKVFYNEIDYIKSTYGVTNSEVLFLINLGKYLSWEENLLIDEDGKPINQKMLIKLLGCSRNKIYKVVKSLEEKKCIIRIYDGKDVYFIVNPNIIFKGNKINRNIPNIFKMIGYVRLCDA